MRIDDPTESSRRDAGDSPPDAMALLEFAFALQQQADQGAVDIAEAEQAKVVGVDADCSRVLYRELHYLCAPGKPGQSQFQAAGKQT